VERRAKSEERRAKSDERGEEKGKGKRDEEIVRCNDMRVALERPKKEENDNR
jgi:hypothetical protein